MILKQIAYRPKQKLRWTIIHVILGVVSSVTPFALIAWFYIIFITNINQALDSLRRKKIDYFLFLMMYLISFELLDRMAETSPFLPYELGKYFLVISAIMGILVLGIRNKAGIVMALLVTPAIFYDISGQVVFFDIVNYYLAPLAIGLGIAYIDRLNISEEGFDNLLRLLWLTALASLAFTVFKTPDLDNITFTLGAQFETTGGQSSNQVSTVLGFGLFLSIYSIIKRLKFSGYYFLDILIAILFFFQGLLSFSRGGIVVAIIGVLILAYNQLKKIRFQMVVYLVMGLIGLSVIFYVTNNLTGGQLLLRYKGETEGTLAGSKVKTADVITSGRVTIFNEDIELWSENPILGVGCGASRYIRFEDKVVAAHVELSRLLAEHGLLGLIYFIMLIFHFFALRKANKFSPYNALLTSLYAIAILTTFHAAMRTYVTPMLIVITSLKIIKNKE